MNTGKAAVAEFFGTFWLVFGGTGAAVLAASVGNSGIGWLGVALAFGLTVVTMAYAVGHISGAHFNPAITIGLWAGGRFPGGKVPVYVVAQVIGAICASAVLYVIASGKAGFSLSDGFAANGYGAHSPAGYSLTAAIVIEILLTLVFVLVIHGVTDRRAPVGLAPLAIGLTLTLIHLIAIPVDNTSVNPARSLAPALFVGGWALSQLWVFIVFPIVGGIVGGLLYRYLLEVPASQRDKVEGPGESAEDATA
jgi:aquaporin Z